LARAGDEHRSVKTTTIIGLVTICVLFAGCTHSKWTYIQVLDASSKDPVPNAKVIASVYDPINPDPRRTRINEMLTSTNGLAAVKIPMCSTRGVDVKWGCSCGYITGPGDPNDAVGPELLVEKEGYYFYPIYRNNNAWRSEETSSDSPFVVYLIKNPTDGPGNRSQPIRSQTNGAPSAPGSHR
jgi:hypothetical protein